MKTLFLSVPHSGTHFVLEFLVAVLGLDGVSNAKYITAESNCDFAHTHPNSLTKIEGGIFDSLIITLRHPYKTTRTGKLRGASADLMVDSWQALLDASSQYSKILLVVIDGPEENRLSQLMAIAKHFNKEHLAKQVEQYANDWRPVNQSLTDEDKIAIGFAVKAYELWQQ